MSVSGFDVVDLPGEIDSVVEGCVHALAGLGLELLSTLEPEMTRTERE